MSISTSHKYESSKVKISNSHYVSQTFTQAKTQSESLEQESIKVYVSDAEAKVIASKAKKAGLSLNEYMRHAALGFPMP